MSYLADDTLKAVGPLQAMKQLSDEEGVWVTLHLHLFHSVAKIKQPLNYLNELFTKTFCIFYKKLFNCSFEHQKIRKFRVTFQCCRNILNCNKAANIYLLKVNNSNTRKRCEIRPKPTIKTSERLHFCLHCYFEHLTN